MISRSVLNHNTEELYGNSLKIITITNNTQCKTIKYYGIFKFH